MSAPIPDLLARNAATAAPLVPRAEEGARAAPPSAPRHNGWTAARRRLFCRTLAAGGSVSLACARVGLSREAAYKARRRDAAFARAWQRAQAEARAAARRAFLAGLPAPLRAALAHP